MTFWNRNRKPVGTGIDKKNRKSVPDSKKNPKDTQPYPYIMDIASEKYY